MSWCLNFNHSGTGLPWQDSGTSYRQHPPSATQPQQEAAISGHVQRVGPPHPPTHYPCSSAWSEEKILTELPLGLICRHAVSCDSHCSVTFLQLTLELPLINEPQLIILTWIRCFESFESFACLVWYYLLPAVLNAI